jgi:hypothetical protein
MNQLMKKLHLIRTWHLMNLQGRLKKLQGMNMVLLVTPGHQLTPTLTLAIQYHQMIQVGKRKFNPHQT